LPNRRCYPPPVIAERLRACRERIQHSSVDGYLVTSRADQLYLTGFDGEDAALLILPHRVYIVTDGRFQQEAAAIGWASSVTRTGPLPEAIARLLRRHRLERVGFQPEHLSVNGHAALRRAVRPARLATMPEVVGGLRLVKDQTEVIAIEKAVRVAEAAFRAVVRRIRPGISERELAARLHHEMLRRGASEASFPVIVAEGPNAARPHARPSDRKIRAGSLVLVDWGARVDQYCSDLTRVIFVRRIPPRLRRMYENVLAAQIDAIRAIRPGARMCDVDGKARARLKRAGMSRQFSHGLGHGLGLEVHEPPRLAKRMTDPLQAGMVVTVEPGVYYPGLGGVRIEDDVLVTRDGCRVLSKLAKNADAMVV